MKKVHVKMNKVLATVLAALLVCSSVSMSSKADTVSPAASSGEVSDGVDTDASAGGADTNVPTDGTDANVSADMTDAKAPADGTDTGASADVTATAEPTKAPAEATAESTKEPAEAEATAEPTKAPAEAEATAEPTKAPAEAAATAEPTKAPAEAAATAEPTKAPAEAAATAEPTKAPAEAAATAEPTKAPAEAAATAEPTKAPAEAAATAEPTKAPAEAAATAEPTKAPADAAATAEPTKAPADAAATAEPTKAPSDASATAKPTESPAPAAATAAPTQSPAPANSAAAPTASSASANGAGISTYATDGAYIFRYDGETATAGVMGLSQESKYGKTKALKMTSGKSVDVPITAAITEGMVVFDIELCPSSKDVQSVIFKNSNGDVLFVICADAKTTKRIYLSDAKAGSSLVDLGAYAADRWHRVKTEFYLDDSKDGKLQFAVSVSYYAKGSSDNEKYDENVTEWTFVGSATQDDLLKTSSSANGTVSGTETFDLKTITIVNEGNSRWIGDISLYNLKEDITFATPPGEQMAGQDFVPGDTAIEVTYPNGEKETLKLADMLYGVDYTIEGYDKNTPAGDNVPITICYGGKKLETTVKVNLAMTGIQVKTNPDKTTYKVGDSFDKTGLVVQEVYSDGSTKVLAEDAYEVTAPDMGIAGRQKVVVKYKKDDKFTCDFTIRVIAESLPNQGFSYIDESDISGLALSGTVAVAADSKGSNDTNKLQVKGVVKKTLDQAIDRGIVTFETVGFQNGKTFGIRILDSEGNALINYAQQSSGNLNMYKDTAITGSGNTVNLASKRGDKWVRVVTEIDLDASNEDGVLQFEMNTYYKDAYTDEEWTHEKTVTQKEAFLDYNVASGCSTEGLTMFDIQEIQFESGDTSYVDDIEFVDGITKTLQSMEITQPATKLEYVQGSELNTAGLELTGTYKVEYSDGRPSETKKLKINRYETEYDFSQIKNESEVIIKVTNKGKVFTEKYTVKVTAKPDSSYVTFRYTDEESAALVGFDGNQIGVTSGDIGVDDNSNTSNKIKLNKGTSTLKLAEAVSTGTVHFETEFLTTATSGASLFMRILNSEGHPMIDLAQYGSSNLNLYLDKNTTGDYAHRFGSLPVKQWARAEIDIDLDKSKEQGHLVFDAVVWTTDDYGSEQWTKFAEFDQNVYINGNGTVHSANGSASTQATKFDVASIELQNAGGTNYYDNMFFEAINGKTSKVLTGLEIVSPARKTTYNVGDKANTSGLVLNGTYEYTFSDGRKEQTEARIMKFTASLDSSMPGENVLVTISAGGKTVTYPVTVLPNGNLAQIEEYLVDYVNNVLVSLGEDGEVKVNKRQILLPSRYENGETLNWEVVSGDAELAEGVLTVNPSEDGATEVMLLVTMLATNEDGDGVEVKKQVTLAVPKDSKQTVDDSMTTEESIRTVLEAMYVRGLFSGQANMKDVDAIMAGLDRDITTEEIAVMLVNLFDIDTTYADTRIDRADVGDDAWYSKYVKAAFQLSVETMDSRKGKMNYGIGKGISEANIRYMVDRIVKIDQTTLPSDYADRMFE